MSEFKEIILREKEKSLHISRLPKKTKEEFLQFANDEFCSDFGLCFKYIWDTFKIWKVFFENMDMKLDIMLSLLNNKPEKESITFLSGKKVERRPKK